MHRGILGQRPHSTKPGSPDWGLTLGEVLGDALPLNLIEVDQIRVPGFRGEAPESGQVVSLSTRRIQLWHVETVRDPFLVLVITDRRVENGFAVLPRDHAPR